MLVWYGNWLIAPVGLRLSSCRGPPEVGEGGSVMLATLLKYIVAFLGLNVPVGHTLLLSGVYWGKIKQCTIMEVPLK